MDEAAERTPGSSLAAAGLGFPVPAASHSAHGANSDGRFCPLSTFNHGVLHSVLGSQQTWVTKGVSYVTTPRHDDQRISLEAHLPGIFQLWGI
ncbi:hypothetical protein JOB18_019381 [Solea senegalensis]|uniref:Uncharacterized protein n=1 Tax=Solea senegalensis TaxID=28829 RepID=A0AAV6RYN6_SOLSE|nr:hypothetical protein JOB18_019381 [Solea senegalensis]